MIKIKIQDSAALLPQQNASAQFRTAHFHLGSTRDGYLTQCVPLHRATIKGDWKEAEKLIERDSTLLTSAITKECETVLHVAVQQSHVQFVEKLVKQMHRDDLKLQERRGINAFCYAAAVGNVQIAMVMEEKNPLLPTIRGGAGEGLTPLYWAVLHGKSDMASYLFPKTTGILGENDWNIVFLTCIKSGLYDLALKMLDRNERLVSARCGDNNETGLHLLAYKYPVCDCQRPNYRKNPLHLCMKDGPLLKLIKRMWKIVLTLDDSEMMKVIREPSQVTSIAAEVGNFEFLSVALSSYPRLILELNNIGQSIIHIAVLHRHASIFNLIHEIGPMKDFILASVDDNQNTLLHAASKLAPPGRLNIVSGAAPQMMLELSWFEEVKKIMQPPLLFDNKPSLLERKNSEGITPRQLFTKEHEELLKRGESWMKERANSCMVLLTLIVAGVFSAAFSLPGGNNDDTKSPNYLEKSPFLIFALSDSIALFSSCISIITFLSISRYEEEDFLKSLPLKLISGFVAFFVSIINMLVAFCSAAFITYYHGLNWVPALISALALLPIIVFICLQFSLMSDIVYSAYRCSSLLGQANV